MHTYLVQVRTDGDNTVVMATHLLQEREGGATATARFGAEFPGFHRCVSSAGQQQGHLFVFVERQGSDGTLVCVRHAEEEREI